MTATEYITQIKKHLCAHFKLTDDKVEAMLPSFMTALSGHLDALDEALLDKDMKTIGVAGHTMKGALLNLGLNDWAEIALSIEKAGKNNDATVDYAALAAELRERIEIIL